MNFLFTHPLYNRLYHNILLNYFFVRVLLRSLRDHYYGCLKLSISVFAGCPTIRDSISVIGISTPATGVRASAGSSITSTNTIAIALRMMSSSYRFSGRVKGVLRVTPAKDFAQSAHIAVRDTGIFF